MGKLSRGFLGGFQGQLGTAYGCFWRLMDLIKAMPRKSNKPATAKQLVVQAELALMTGFLSWLKPIIKIGFKDAKSNQSPMNAAVKYNLKEALTGVYPMTAIDYPKIRFSDGKLEVPYNDVLSTVVDAELKVVWELNITGTPNSNLTDKASFVVYNPSKEKFIILRDVATRDDLGYDIALPAMYSGDNVHTWMCFVSDDNEMVSTTTYLGATVVM